MDHIDFLRKTRRLPDKDQVRVRLAPEKEITWAPEEGERVIFRSHFLRGLGMPAVRIESQCFLKGERRCYYPYLV